MSKWEDDLMEFMTNRVFAHNPKPKPPVYAGGKLLQEIAKVNPNLARDIAKEILAGRTMTDEEGVNFSQQYMEKAMKKKGKGGTKKGC